MFFIDSLFRSRVATLRTRSSSSPSSNPSIHTSGYLIAFSGAAVINTPPEQNGLDNHSQ
tara:strand:+ start:488 stop:664 length:177 start_codon:yes stop_codon:yes gene_type:complete